MSMWEAISLGLLQGFTEFFPVSSSGHLVMGQTLLGVNIPGILFELMVHLATLLSVVVVYRSRVGGLATGAIKGEPGAWRYLILLALATIPAAAVGLTLGDQIEELFQSPGTVGFALLFTGAVLWSTRWAEAGKAQVGWRAALIIGVAQSLALVPGVSRAGMTVAMALWLGVPRKQAAEFAFLMLLPAVAGAVLLHAPDLVEAIRQELAAPLLWGSLAAAVAGVLAIKWFVALMARDRFHQFAPYCWTVGAGFLLYLWLA
ncbi:MAG: undecaprenyl-diphosphate phosphatase [Gemmatimonadota bacterium]